MTLSSRSLSILIYHRVLTEPDELLPDLVSAGEFERQMRALSRWFNVLPLHEAVARLDGGTLPARAACVTFDDGYADNAEVAMPILLRTGIPAIFFIATAFLDGGRMWNDTVIETVRASPGAVLDAGAAGLGMIDISSIPKRRSALGVIIDTLKYLPVVERQERVMRLAAENAGDLPTNLMMTQDQVRALHAAGMEVGAHTHSHPILARLDSPGAAHEIRTGRDTLGRIVNAPIRFFAYPNGKPGQDYRAEHVAMVRDLGFEAAVSTAWGVSRVGSDPYQLARFTPWDKAPMKFLLRLLHNALRPNVVVA